MKGLATYKCIHCDAETQLMYTVNNPKTATKTSDHPVCVNCLVDELKSLMTRNYTEYGMSQPIDNYIKIGQTISVTFEAVKMTILRCHPMRGFFIDSDTKADGHNAQESRPTFQVLLQGNFNDIYDAWPFYADTANDILKMVSGILKDAFPENKYPKTLVEF